MDQSKSSKGLNASAAVFIIVGVLVVLVGLIPVYQFLNTLGTSTAQDRDRQNFEELAANINNKCKDVTGGTTGAATVPITMSLTLRRAERLYIEEHSATEQTLKLVFPEAGDAEYQITGCDVKIKNTVSNSHELGIGSWSVSIKHKDGTQNPPVIIVEAS
ncbi:MAG: hypothetical protein ABEJ75_04205 [Candidatus Nanohaloarchaea archaeon]